MSTPAGVSGPAGGATPPAGTIGPVGQPAAPDQGMLAAWRQFWRVVSREVPDSVNRSRQIRRHLRRLGQL